MAVGAIPLSGRGIAFLSGDAHFCHNVQGIGTDRRADNRLHRVAWSAVGHQAYMESYHRQPQDQTLVDCINAIPHGSIPRFGGINHSN